jgi:hypothetical protein
MSNFRYPSINGSTEREQLAQIKSFLHQLVDNLNYSFSVIVDGKKESLSTEELRDQMMQEIQKLNSKINQLTPKEE